MGQVEKKISEETFRKLGKTIKGTSYEKEANTKIVKKDLEKIFDKKIKKK